MTLSVPSVSPIARYITIAKWVGIGLLALALITAIGVMIAKVNAWHRDSQALPAITAARDAAASERDQAKKAKADQEVNFAGTLDNVSGQIAKLTARMGELQTQLDRDRADRMAAYNHFMETTANVPNDAALGSAGDLLVRRGLLDLLRNPDTGQLSRGDGGDAARGNSAGVPGTAAGTDHVPGQPPRSDHQSGKAVVPAAGMGGRQGAKRAAEGRRRRRADLGAGRAGRQAASGQRVRQAVPGEVEVIVCGARCCGKSAKLALIELGLRAAGVMVVHG